jgi:PAS domain S-box-containing protein
MDDRIIKQGIFSNPFVGIEVSDVDGRITVTNPFFRNLVGYKESELTILTVGDLCHRDDKERELDQRRQLIAGDVGQLTFRKRYLGKSGKTIWGDTSITAVHGDNGQCEALVATMVDVTAQRRHELLQQGQTRVLDLLYRNRSLQEVCTAIVETIEVVEKGVLCSILQLNSACGTLHKLAAPSLPDFYNDAIDGMTIGDGVGSCGEAAFHGRRVVVADILNHPNWARARRLVEKTSLRSCWSQPILANDGKVLGTFAIYYTEPREPGPFELELINSAAELAALAINHKQALSELQKRNQLKSEFISTAAHELRTPLSSIMGYAELLRQAQELGISQPDRHEEFISVIVEKSEMLSRLVGDLLDVSKIENGFRLELQKKPALISKTITNVIEHYQRNAPQHVFSLLTDSALPETVVVDEVRIVQVLDNLLSNAVKYSPNGGLIELAVTAEHGKLHFSVVDRGIGMSEIELERIFEKYYRANPDKPSIQGMGLGMSIARNIIEAHGGEIKVNSTPGEGTRVYFTVAHS